PQLTSFHEKTSSNAKSFVVKVAHHDGTPHFSTTAMNPILLNSSRFVSPTQLSIDLPLPLVPFNKQSASTWASHYSESTDSIIYGRILCSYPKPQTAILAHWTPFNDTHNTDASLTPQSRQATFQRCPGCPLNDVTIKQTARIVN